MKIMYVLKGIAILYISILVGIFKEDPNLYLRVFSIIFILSLVLHSLMILIICVFASLTIILIITMSMYRDFITQQNRNKFDDAMNNVMQSLDAVVYSILD